MTLSQPQILRFIVIHIPNVRQTHHQRISHPSKDKWVITVVKKPYQRGKNWVSTSPPQPLSKWINPEKVKGKQYFWSNQQITHFYTNFFSLVIHFHTLSFRWYIPIRFISQIIHSFVFRCVRQEHISIRGSVRPSVHPSVCPLRLCKKCVSLLFLATVRFYTETNDQ